MKKPKASHITNGRNHRAGRRSGHEIHHPTFREIYETINHQDDFNEPQLFFLSRLVDRKLKAFDPRLNPDDLETKPYQCQANTKRDLV